MSVPTTTIHIDGHVHTVAAGLTQGESLILLAGVTHPQQLVLEMSGDLDIPILPTDQIILAGGRQRFSTGDGSPELPDNPCLRHPIKIKVNDVHAELSHAKMTGAQLKALDASGDQNGRLFADLPDLADEWIDDGVRLIVQQGEGFAISPCGNVGDVPLQRDFGKLKAAFPRADLRPCGTNHMLVLPRFELPSGWNQPEVELMVIIPAGYPFAAVDMFWVSPSIALANGGMPEGANQIESYNDSAWQRFSWHYSRSWNPNRDTLKSHIAFCAQRLTQLR